MARQYPSVRHDPESDALYVYLRAGEVARTKAIDDLRMVDIAEDGTVLGIEFLDVSAGVELDDVPFRPTIAELIQPFGFKVFA